MYFEKYNGLFYEPTVVNAVEGIFTYDFLKDINACVSNVYLKKEPRDYYIDLFINDEIFATIMLNGINHITGITIDKDHPCYTEELCSRVRRLIGLDGVLILPGMSQYKFMKEKLAEISKEKYTATCDDIVHKDMLFYCNSHEKHMRSTIANLLGVDTTDWVNLPRSEMVRLYHEAWNMLMLSKGVFLQSINIYNDAYIIYDILDPDSRTQSIIAGNPELKRKQYSKVFITSDIQKYADATGLTFESTVNVLISLLPEAYVEYTSLPTILRAYNAYHLLHATGKEVDRDFNITRINPMYN